MSDQLPWVTRISDHEDVRQVRRANMSDVARFLRGRHFHPRQAEVGANDVVTWRSRWGWLLRGLGNERGERIVGSCLFSASIPRPSLSHSILLPRNDRASNMVCRRGSRYLRSAFYEWCGC